MNAQDTTVANADLWARYFENEFTRWTAPFGRTDSMSEVAEGTAARVAGFLTLVAAGPIAWLYNANAPQVTEMRRESLIHAVDVPADDDEAEYAEYVG